MHLSDRLLRAATDHPQLHYLSALRLNKTVTTLKRSCGSRPRTKVSTALLFCTYTSDFGLVQRIAKSLKKLLLFIGKTHILYSRRVPILHLAVIISSFREKSGISPC